MDEDDDVSGSRAKDSKIRQSVAKRKHAEKGEKPEKPSKHAKKGTPTWVWFTVMATSNHFWLDIVAGVGIAFVGGAMIAWTQDRRLAPSPALFPSPRA